MGVFEFGIILLILFTICNILVLRGMKKLYSEFLRQLCPCRRMGK